MPKRALAVFAVAATLAGCGGASAPDAAEIVPDGFDPAGFRVVPSTGDPCDLCLWVASTDEQRRRGLMGVTALGRLDGMALDGMAFVYDSPRTTAFTMRNTLLPLSIAFFDDDGRFLDAFDMEPCEAEPCPRYATPSDISVAVEVLRGDLEGFGIGPGARLVPLDRPCA